MVLLRYSYFSNRMPHLFHCCLKIFYKNSISGLSGFLFCPRFNLDFLKHFCNKKNMRLLTRHGSLEAVLGSTKMTWKTKAGDGCGVMSGVQNNGFWNVARSSHTQLISKTKFCKQILQKSQYGPGKWIWKNL
jgi:hypothetical protein